MTDRKKPHVKRVDHCRVSNKGEDDPKFVGGDYVIKASVGHIKDLRRGELGVDLEKDFQPEYVPIRQGEDHW